MKTYKLKIPIKKLFQFLNVDNDLYDCIQPSTRNVSIQAPDGKYVKILAFVKKRGNVRSFKTDIGSTITCDEKHLIKQSNGTYAHIKNTNHVIIKNRPHKIIESVRLGTQDVYDIALDYPHEYITASEIVCHNTTAGKILCKNIECDALFINASDESGIDTIRNKVKNFASSVGFAPLKIVFLDECLDENTLVRVLRDGVEQDILIKDLLDNTDIVKTWNIAESRVEWMLFKLLDKGMQDTLEIELENGEIVICTPDHKWYVEDESGATIIVKASQLDKYHHILSP